MMPTPAITGTRNVHIIGAGIGGLSAGVRLAASGVRVKITEKNSTPGGKVNLHLVNGYSFDTGASLLTMRHVVEDLFASVNRRLEDYLTIEPLEPLCRYKWQDGATLDASTYIEQMETEIRRLAPCDVSAFRRYLSDARRKYEVAERTFLAHSLNDLPKLLRPRYARDLAAISSWRTLAAHNASYFRSPHIRQLFNRFATYNGSSPYRAPATFALIPFVEFGLGAWYVRGGMYELPRALVRLAGEFGVEIETNTEVSRIIVEGGTARGVAFKRDGENQIIEERCDAVIANSDAIETYRRLIPPENRRIYTDKKLARIEPSCSGFVLLLGVNRKYDSLAHHNIFFSKDYAAEFRSIFDELRPAHDPTIYVCATSRTDATQAPSGHENLFVLVNAPATSEHTCWGREEADAYRDLIISKLEAFGLKGLKAAIDYQRIITPEDFENIYHAHRGSIYGVSSNSMMSAFMRVPNRARDIQNLYFAGGATHPGGGIPLVMLSGKFAAEMMLKNWFIESSAH
ncbi:MAG: phytoene desaturase family protein [Pyrinomonadaceae bacterium MAG19_C2-C3]|nr:phytoene desaturase family protein [Pyrinomonadaceae bacterium MAG19_C2-C3]